MGESKTTMTFSETKKDFRNSWALLKENYKAFLSTEIFAGIAFFITIILTSFIVGFIIVSFTSTTLREVITGVSSSFIISHIVRSGIMLVCMWIFFGFLNCQFGLAHEIMSSGEMYAEFKSSFGYFKKNWWQYPILNFTIMAIGGMLPMSFRLEIYQNIESSFFTFLYLFVQCMVFFLWFITFISTLPSITFQCNFRHAFIESFRIIKNNFRRLVSTWGVFFTIFILPGLLVTILTSVYFTWWILTLNIIYILWLSLIGFPLMSLLATGLYKNVKLERFKPLIE
ncbi:hypothetical protein NEF87_004992 [Candidatus Lokiarchaeum ossiferum]|uniref:DUF4013 domain-containing protein n=1 Tax=Candidatus Lokiarchaeum ossiferum TaxID=2951803 RepID=A0ABY6HYV4_9ARCH|nr:hypothetical protein NEF87_004992 [Candidatus Lokiarchaeum sp. B-35]